MTALEIYATMFFSVAAATNLAPEFPIEEGPTYEADNLRRIFAFGVRLGMPLEQARAALQMRGFKRDPARTDHNDPHGAWLTDARYYRGSDATEVHVFYSEPVRGKKQVSRIFLWEETALKDETGFETFLAERYGVPTLVTEFQRHDQYVWSQERVGYVPLLQSRLCMQPFCVSRVVLPNCNAATISRQVVLSAVFNTNMPGKVMLAVDFDDLGLQARTLMSDGEYPSRKVCPDPVF